MVRHGERVHPTWVMMLVKVNHLLLTINSATNILLYSYKVEDFKPWEDFTCRVSHAVERGGGCHIHG